MDNRTKERQLDLFADRTSTQVMRSNQIRLYFASFVYVLTQAVLRLALAGRAIHAKARFFSSRCRQD